MEMIYPNGIIDTRIIYTDAEIEKITGEKLEPMSKHIKPLKLKKPDMYVFKPKED